MEPHQQTEEQQSTAQISQSKLATYSGIPLHTLTDGGDFYLVQLKKLLMFVSEGDEEGLQVVLLNSLTRKQIAVRNFGEITTTSEIFIAKTEKEDTVAISHGYDTYILASGYQPQGESIATDGAVTSSVFVPEDGEDVLYLGVMASLVRCKKEDGRFSDEAPIEVGDEEKDLINNIVYNHQQKVIAVGMVSHVGSGSSTIVIWHPESQQTLYSFETTQKLLIQLTYIPIQEEILYTWEENVENLGMQGLSVLKQIQDEFDSEDLSDESLGDLQFLFSKDQVWIKNENILDHSCHLSRIKQSADRSIDRIMTVKDKVIGISGQHGFVVTQHRKRLCYYIIPISLLEKTGMAKSKTIELSKITDYTSFN